MMAAMKSYPGLLFVALSAMTTAGCDTSPPPVPTPDAGTRDASTPTTDAGPPPDGGDAAVEVMDGSMTGEDGGTSTGTCSFGGIDDLFKLETDIEARGRLVRVAGGAEGWAAIWAGQADGFRDVRAALVPSSGSGATISVLDVTDDPSIEIEPAIAYAGGRWLASYASNATANFEAYTQLLNAALEPSGAPTQLTTTAGVREDSTSVIPAGAGYLVSWVQDDMVAGTREVYVQAIGADFTPSGAPQIAATGSAGTTVPELAAVDSGAALALARGTAGGGEIVLQMLGANGSSRGAPTVVADTGIEGTVDVAGGSDGGAVLYGLIVGGARSEIRFRGFDRDGMLPGGTRVLVGSPAEGRDGSITPFAGGYAAAYRRIDSPSEATIVVALLDLGGEIQDEIELGPTSPDGGRTTIEASGDGHLLVGWAQIGASTTDIVTARIRCD